MNVELDRIRVKVWNGEVLSDFELRELETAAQREGGPIWRTTVAQALINADAITQAIPILEAVRRDFPGELQAHLALGRALVSVEKWSEAEGPLKRALELNPGDPEPTKALATIALRRGEWARARAWIDEILRIDPLDEEAKLLQMELERQGPGDLESAPTLDRFSRALTEKLKAQSTRHVVARGQLTIRLGRGGVARFDLPGLFAESLRSGRSLTENVELLARDFAERSLGIPAGRVPLLTRVLPVVRDSSFLERGEGAARREGPAGLWFFFAIDDPEDTLYVPEGLLPAYRITLEELDASAWKNLETRQTEVRALELEQGAALRLSQTPTGLWALAHGDGHDAARLLTVSHQAAIAKTCGSGPLRVYLGLRELVLFCREDDAASVKKLEGLDAAREGIAGAWRLHEGRLTALPEWDLEER